MNKHKIKYQLYNNILKDIYYQLNEDLLSDLDDDDDDDDDSEYINFDKHIIKYMFKNKCDSKIMNNYKDAGDFLIYNENYNTFYVLFNEDLLNKFIKDELNTETRGKNAISLLEKEFKSYGKLIAISYGKGIWVSTEYIKKDEINVPCAWGDEYATDLTNTYVKAFRKGWFQTEYIWNTFSESIWKNGIKGNDVKKVEDSNYRILWGLLYNFNVTGIGNGCCYIPTMSESKYIQKVNDKINLIPDSLYWTATQDDSCYDVAYTISFFSGKVSNTLKSNGFAMKCFALIYFN